MLVLIGLPKVLPGKFEDSLGFDSPPVFAELFFYPFQVGFPYFDSSLLVKPWIKKTEMYPGFECSVHLTHSIGCEEQYALYKPGLISFQMQKTKNQHGMPYAIISKTLEKHLSLLARRA